MTSGIEERVPAMKGCFDADHHIVDTLDGLPGYMDPSFRERGWRVVTTGDGMETLAVGDFVSALDPDHPAVPGSFRENILRLRAGEDLDPFQGDMGPLRPEFVDREERLAFMDREGIEAVLVFPGTPMESRWIVDEPDAAQLYANVRAVNRLMGERWGWRHLDRIHAAALVSLQDLELALEELDRVLAEGCKLVNLIPGPVSGSGRSPADPCFDPFWARIDESRVLVSLHTAPASHGAYRRMLDGFWEPIEGLETGQNDITSAFMGFQMFNERPIMDTIAALILHNLFGRFPDVRVISVENGAFWVPYTLKLMNKSYAINQRGFWLGGKPERPSSVFRRHVSVTPFHEDDVASLVELIGADAITFGSDFPHPEGLASPVNDFLDDLRLDDEEAVGKIMRSNLEALLDRVGT